MIKNKSQEDVMDTMQIESQVQSLVVSNMVAIGGREWIKNEMHRVYFNLDVTVPALGLVLSFYNTGNISRALLNGETISNCEATRILHSIDGKIWYDVKSDKWYSQGVSSQYSHDIIAGIKSRLSTAGQDEV